MAKSDTDTDRLWLWWLPFLAASAVFAAWASFTSQQFLGELMLWDQPWLMPAILDNLAAGTVLAFILIPGIRTAARWVSGAVLLTSAVANAQAHFYNPNSADLGVPMWVAIGWSVLPPVAVFVIAHFMVAAKEGTTNAKPRRAELVESAGGDTGDPAPDRGAGVLGGVDRRPRRRGQAKAPRAKDRVPADRSASAGREVLARRILDHDWQDLTWDELAKRLPAGRVQAGHARKLAREMAAAGTNGNATLVE